MPYLSRQKYVLSLTSCLVLEHLRVTSRPFIISLYLRYIRSRRRTPPFTVELVVVLRNLFSIYKLCIIVNDKIVPLHQRGGMGNDFWKVPVGSSQSPECGDWEEPAGIIKLTVREATGLCNCLKMGTFGERDFFC